MRTIHDVRYATIISRFKQRRKELGWTQEQAAQRLHVPRTWIGKVERRERRIDLVEAWQLCKAYGIAFHELETVLAEEKRP